MSQNVDLQNAYLHASRHWGCQASGSPDVCAASNVNLAFARYRSSVSCDWYVLTVVEYVQNPMHVLW
jgi:hypothetical protein